MSKYINTTHQLPKIRTKTFSSSIHKQWSMQILSKITTTSPRLKNETIKREHWRREGTNKRAETDMRRRQGKRKRKRRPRRSRQTETCVRRVAREQYIRSSAYSWAINLILVGPDILTRLLSIAGHLSSSNLTFNDNGRVLWEKKSPYLSLSLARTCVRENSPCRSHPRPSMLR